MDSLFSLFLKDLTEEGPFHPSCVMCNTWEMWQQSLRVSVGRRVLWGAQEVPGEGSAEMYR